MKIIIAEARNKVNLAIPPQKPPSEKTPLTNHLPSRLPDASIMLNSPSLPSNTSEIYDHTSAVAAAMAQNVSRKRDFKASTTSYPHGKVPKGNLPHPKNVQKTESGLLCPPQLSGRLSMCINSTETVVRGWVKSLDPNDLVGGTKIGPE